MKNNNNDNAVITILPLMALFAPFLVWLIEFVFPYPYIIEELIKTLLIIFVINQPSKKKKFFLAALIGFLFSLTENVFYMLNFFQLNSAQLFLRRIILTTALHILTSIIIVLPTFIKKNFFSFGLIIAIFIHYLYNLYI